MIPKAILLQSLLKSGMLGRMFEDESPYENDDYERAIKNSAIDQGIPDKISNPEDKLRVAGGPIGLANITNCIRVNRLLLQLIYTDIF
jgi:hypothetical protein